MEEIINKIDTLSREITKFVIDNELNEEPLFSAFDKENNLIFNTYKVKVRDSNYTCFYSPNDIIEIVHTTGKITLPVNITKEQLLSLYQQLEKEYNDWKNNLDLEKIKEKKRALKLKEKQELKLRISKLEEEINEL